MIFTSGGTEADNLAIKGLALANPRGRHLVVSPIEHEAVLESAEYLARVHGFEVSEVEVDAAGVVTAEALARVIRPDTALVSVQFANNEIGTVQPIAELAGVAHAVGALMHTDAVQAAGWLPLSLDGLGVDALSLAGHKVGAPKGTGALVVRGRLPLEPVLHGGGQERGRRSGTENVAGAVAFATALRLAEAERADAAARVGSLGAELTRRIVDGVPGARLTGDPEHRLPGTVSFVFPGTSGEAVLLELERDGVVCSSGSACAAGSDEPSHVLTAIGVPAELAQTAVRFTLGTETTADEIDGCRGIRRPRGLGGARYRRDLRAARRRTRSSRHAYRWMSVPGNTVSPDPGCPILADDALRRRVRADTDWTPHLDRTRRSQTLIPDRRRRSPPAPERRHARSTHEHSDVEALHGARNNRVIWLLLAAAFVVILNETIMGVAIPHLVVDLGITISQAQWLTTAFMLTMAVVIPITGFLLQRFATRPIFIAAMSLFSTGTLIAALAPGFEVLLLARVVQASGTAIMMPLLMTTLMTLVAPSDRGRLMGRVSIVMSVAPAIGPTISGLILNFLSWRFMFWLVLPIALVMLIVGIRRVENVSEPRGHPHRRVLGRAVGVRLRRARLRAEPHRRRGRGLRRQQRAHVDLARRRRDRHRARSSWRQLHAAAPRPRTARPAHLPVGQLRGVDRAHDGDDGRAVRHDHPAADLPAERARTSSRSRRACCCCPAG